MKGMVFDIKKYAIHDGPGIRTTIFLKGCPMNCIWCHNPESQKMNSEVIHNKRKINQKVFQDKEIIGKQMTINEVWEIIVKDKIFYDESKGGVTFSGGEPLSQPEFVKGIAKRCKENGINTVIDTCGYFEYSVIETIIPFIDLFLFDIKLINSDLHKKYTGVSNNLILENFNILINKNKDVKVRFPIIPGITDTHENIQDVISFLKGKVDKIDILPFHAIAKNKYAKLNRTYKLEDMEEPDDIAINLLKETFKSSGFTVQIGG